MSIVLLESSHSREPGESARKLVSMENAKVRHPPWQFPVASFSMLKQQAVAWAVHGLQPELILFDFESEHIILVVCPMTRCLPELCVVHVWSDDLLVVAFPVLGSQERQQGIIDASAMWKEEAGSRGQLMEEK